MSRIIWYHLDCMNDLVSKMNKLDNDNNMKAIVRRYLSKKGLPMLQVDYGIIFGRDDIWYLAFGIWQMSAKSEVWNLRSGKMIWKNDLEKRQQALWRKLAAQKVATRIDYLNIDNFWIPNEKKRPRYKLRSSTKKFN